MSTDDAKLKVLLVDDDTEVLEYLGSIFRSLDCEVTAVNKVRSLRSHLRAQPDVIVLDLIMPERDGVQVIDAMARAGIESGLIIISACPDRVLNSAENFARMSGLRVLGSLRKPVFREHVKELLEPLRQRVGVKPHVEEQEFFRLLESGHLEVHYRPIIDVTRAAVHALEAVPRVRHPKLGLMNPTGMWDTAEAFGAAEKIKQSLLKLAIQDAGRLVQEGLRIPVQCEVVAPELMDAGFADRFLEMCRAAGILPSSMCLLIHEAETRQNFTAALGTLTRLALRGAEIALDDFGTGSLSGGMLARLPVHEIKITAALSTAILRDADSRYRAIDIVAYGERHELRIVAKGAESPEHLGLLMDLGMNLFEGHLISPARSFKEMVYWVRNCDQHLAKLGITSTIRAGR